MLANEKNETEIEGEETTTINILNSFEDDDMIAKEVLEIIFVKDYSKFIPFSKEKKKKR